MRHTYSAEQWLPFPLEVVFAFFANPNNLPRLMPAWQKTRIERSSFTSPPPRPEGSASSAGVAAGAGTTMTISFRPFPLSPVRVPWDAEITEFVWNDHFCDVQHRGPFAYWKHCHRLQARRQAYADRAEVEGTLVRDEVEYAFPLGPLGDLANALFGRRQMKSIFAYRQARAALLLAEGGPG